jgi:hypothetical protein
MDQMRGKWHGSQDENKMLATKVDALERYAIFLPINSIFLVELFLLS